MTTRYRQTEHGQKVTITERRWRDMLLRTERLGIYHLAPVGRRVYHARTDLRGRALKLLSTLAEHTVVVRLDEGAGGALLPDHELEEIIYEALPEAVNPYEVPPEFRQPLAMFTPDVRQYITEGALEEQVRQMSRTTRWTADQIREAHAVLARGGLSAHQVRDAMESAAVLANQGAQPLDLAAHTVAEVLRTSRERDVRPRPVLVRDGEPEFMEAGE